MEASKPILRMTSRPTRSAAGKLRRPVFTAPSVTVTWARTAAPATSPLSASIPLGTSTATTSGRVARALIRSAPPPRRRAGLAWLHAHPHRVSVQNDVRGFKGIRELWRFALCRDERVVTWRPTSAWSSSFVTLCPGASQRWARQPRRARSLAATTASRPLLPLPTRASTVPGRRRMPATTSAIAKPGALLQSCSLTRRLWGRPPAHASRPPTQGK